jgi:ATP-binding cassette subfamily B protein
MSIGGIAEVFGDLQRCMAAAERVFALLEIDNLEQSNKSLDCHVARRATRNDKSPFIIFDNVKFSYPSRPDILVLQGLSLSIERGEFIGIVGASGAGKTTIMQLLLRFFTENSGDIFLGKTNIRDIAPYTLRKIIGYAPQDPFMFRETIRYNIHLSNDKSDAKNVADVTAINDFASLLPQGLDTYIGTKGAQISGGQRQRIALARTLLTHPEILLLDEATSSLDQTSERLIMQNIRSMMPHSTIVSIAHRISSIEHADRILVMDKGKIIASGSHQNLLNS